MICINAFDVRLLGEEGCCRTCQEGTLVLSKADGLNVGLINGGVDNCELDVRIIRCVLCDVVRIVGRCADDQVIAFLTGCYQVCFPLLSGGTLKGLQLDTEILNCLLSTCVTGVIIGLVAQVSGINDADTDGAVAFSGVSACFSCSGSGRS